MDRARSRERRRKRRRFCRCRICRSITASRTRCRASRSRSSAACSRSSAATAWARRRSATRSSASCPFAPASIRFDGRELVGVEPHQIARAGVGYRARRDVVCGRACRSTRRCVSARVARARGRSIASIRPFRGLAERRGNGGGQLSGGEQQMLAIARALLGNPRLLVMDEPTEGLAPMIVGQVRDLLIRLAHEEDISILVVEQNIGVATSVSDHVAIMVNGRVNRIMDASALAADRDLQQRLLGVGRHGHDETDAAPAAVSAAADGDRRAQVFRVARGGEAATAPRRPSIAPIIFRTAGICVRRDQASLDARRLQSRRSERASASAHTLRGAHRTHGARRRHVRHQGRRTPLRP